MLKLSQIHFTGFILEDLSDLARMIICLDVLFIAYILSLFNPPVLI